MARLDLVAGPPEEFSMDKWTAYQADAQAVLDFFGTGKASNPIVLTGDIHTNWACDLHARPADPASAIVGAEFAGTSITSGRDGNEISARNQAILPDNPHVKFHNGQRGYVRCTVTPRALDDRLPRRAVRVAARRLGRHPRLAGRRERPARHPPRLSPPARPIRAGRRESAPPRRRRPRSIPRTS